MDTRPRVAGKFLFVGDDKLYVRGVTYGTFRPGENGDEFPLPKVVDYDFAQMTASGINAVRTYTVPPRWLLDAAQRHGLRVMVGLPWEQHVAFLDDPRRIRSIEERVRTGVRACAGHPAVLCYAIGNEIPASIVRWYGPPRVERFLRRLYRAARVEDPEGLITYVNYPSTEYLCLPFVDLVCMNVYLEQPEALDNYLARLQNIAGDRPLLLAEIGLDSRRNGEERQATTLDWQLRASFAAGCAGAFVFAWTDEWYRGGYDIQDWDFGLTDRERRPKPALAAVGAALAEAAFPEDVPWPRISVVVCSRNGARTLAECMDGLGRVVYPDFEVILVDDGSTDDTAAIGHAYGVQVISTENRGLSSARNTGMQAATGEIVAYIDDDVIPDPDWLTYLAATFLSADYAAVGGPNIAPPGDGRVAACVANAPGNPTHVLLSDREAEHLPGCNMAVWADCLRAVGGFDPRFRVAGDDVDLCWRLQGQGWRLGFSPGAMVWHHRRRSVCSYWKQQAGYGKAEALLERKWPEKFNAAGHLTWSGQIYGKGLAQALGPRWGRVRYGVWGSELFQFLYQPSPGLLRSLPLMPEWYLVILALAALTLLGVLWPPLFLALPLLAGALGGLLLPAVRGAAHASFPGPRRSTLDRWTLHTLTALLHGIQPLARLRGRIQLGLRPWRQRGAGGFAIPRRRCRVIWSERWRAPADWLQSMEAAWRGAGLQVLRGGAFDRWDFELRGGLLGAVRSLMAVEEHGAGHQLVRVCAWPHWSTWAGVLVLLLAALAGWALTDQALTVGVPLAVITVLLVLRSLQEGAAATRAFVRVMEQLSAAASTQHVAPEAGTAPTLAAPVISRKTSEATLPTVRRSVSPTGGPPLLAAEEEAS